MLLRQVQASLDIAIASNPQVTVILLGVLGAAAVVLVAAAWSSVPALVAADPGTLLAQSDPDAAGRPRPRAPGRGIPAA